MAAIHYLVGDATEPAGTGRKVIAHICNDKGGWGKGFVLALSRKWSAPEAHYRSLYQEFIRGTEYGEGFRLGNIQTLLVDNEDRTIMVANMIAQHGYRSPQRPRALDYGALAECFNQLATYARYNNLTVHMPRLGSGEGGGDWSVIEELIEGLLVRKGVEVTVYDLPKSA